jgi:hypothetical protein
VLRPTAETLDSFVDSIEPATEYRLRDVRLDIPDPETAVFRAELLGPPNSNVWARAWVSNEASGALAEAVSPPMTAGDQVTLTLKLVKDGKPELACMRIESAPLDTKHVMHLHLE